MSERDDLIAKLEAMGDAVVQLPAVISEEAAKSKKRGEVNQQETEQYGEESPMSWVDRATASIPIAGERKLGFLKKRFGEENVNFTPRGEVLITGPDGKQRLADPHMTMKELVLAAMPMALPAIAAVEAAVPGATGKWGKAASELVGDVADVGGAIGEAVVQGGAETLGMRGGMGGVKAMAKGGTAGALGGMVAGMARWGASQAVPSDSPEIAFSDAAKRGAVNAAISVPSSALGGVAAVGRTPWSKADPSLVEQRTAREMFGEMRGPVVDEGRRIASTTGAKLMPDELSKNVDAISNMNVIRQSPGNAEKFMAGATIPNTRAYSGFLNRRMDALIGSGLPGVEAGEKVGETVVGLYKDLDTVRKSNWKSGMGRIEEAVGQRTFQRPAYAKLQRDLSRQGIDIGPPPETSTLPQLEQELHEVSRRQYAGGSAKWEKTQDQWIAAQQRNALMEDIEGGLASYSPQGSRKLLDDFKAVRANYAADSRPIDTASDVAVAKILKAGEDKAFEDIPKILLKAKQRQQEMALAVADTASPASGAILRRAAVDAALEDAVAAGSSLEGSRLKDVAKQTGEKLYTPSLAAKGLRDNIDSLHIILGKNSQASKDLDLVLEGFERMDLATKGAKGSQTGRMAMIGDALKAVSGVIFHPVETATTASLYAYRNRITRMLFDDRQRALFIGVTHASADTPARLITSNAARLSAMLAREDSPEEPEK